MPLHVLEIFDDFNSEIEESKKNKRWLEFRLTRNYVTAEIRLCKRAYLEDMLKLTRKQPRRLWSELNRVVDRHPKYCAGYTNR